MNTCLYDYSQYSGLIFMYIGVTALAFVALRHMNRQPVFLAGLLAFVGLSMGGLGIYVIRGPGPNATWEAGYKAGLSEGHLDGWIQARQEAKHDLENHGPEQIHHNAAYAKELSKSRVHTLIEGIER